MTLQCGKVYCIVLCCFPDTTLSFLNHRKGVIDKRLKRGESWGCNILSVKIRKVWREVPNAKGAIREANQHLFGVQENEQLVPCGRHQKVGTQYPI